MKAEKMNKKTGAVLMSFLLFYIGGCWFNTEGPTSPGKVNYETTPTAEPTAVANADFGLRIISEVEGQDENFISSTSVNFRAESTVHPQSNTIVNWSFLDRNFTSDQTTATPPQFIGKNYIMQFFPRPVAIQTPYSGIGRGYPLHYEIIAALTYNAGIDIERKEIRQNNLAELRQEYIDFQVDMANMPGIEKFDNWIPSGDFSNLLTRGNSINEGVCLRHQKWIVWNVLLKAEKVHMEYSSQKYKRLRITSGYRCPAGNRRIGSSSLNSQHLFGTAFDWNQQNSYDNWELAKFIEDNQTSFDTTIIIIYDQNDTPYINDIPDTYELRPTVIEKETGNTLPAVYTHGHVDWRDKW